MPFYDWKCQFCGRVQRDIKYPLDSVPPTRPCECGGDMVQLFDQHQVGFSDARFGTYDYQSGQVITSYGHWKQILREEKAVEQAPIGGNRHVHEEILHEAYKEEKRQKKVSDSITWLDATTEAEAMKEATALTQKKIPITQE